MLFFGLLGNKWYFGGPGRSILQLRNLVFHYMLPPGSKSGILNFNITIIFQNSLLSLPELNSFSSWTINIDRIFFEVFWCDFLMGSRRTKNLGRGRPHNCALTCKFTFLGLIVSGGSLIYALAYLLLFTPLFTLSEFLNPRRWRHHHHCYTL